jgi:hypothetical protein
MLSKVLGINEWRQVFALFDLDVRTLGDVASPSMYRGISPKNYVALAQPPVRTKEAIPEIWRAYLFIMLK